MNFSITFRFMRFFIPVLFICFFSFSWAFADDVVRKAGDQLKLPIEGGEYVFCWCPPGKFLMGSSEDEQKSAIEELPKVIYDDLLLAFKLCISSEIQHEVTLTRGFYMLNTEVTQGLYKSVTGKNPSKFREKKLPVENLSWDSCQQFIEKLNALNVAPAGWEFALPTESQWEYACRAGTTTAYHFGDALKGDKANCDGNNPFRTKDKGKFVGQTTPVGTYPPNDWGLYDMHGNVWEWCSDFFSRPKSDRLTDPTGPPTGTSKIIRGGAWDYLALRCRSAYRNNYVQTYRQNTIGFRIALVQK